MFKRLLTWLRRNKPQGIPDNARHVVQSGGPRGANQQRVLVVPPKADVVIEETQCVDEGIVQSRQSYLNEHGEILEAQRKLANRAWIVAHAPDECLFR